MKKLKWLAPISIFACCLILLFACSKPERSEEKNQIQEPPEVKQEAPPKEISILDQVPEGKEPVAILETKLGNIEIRFCPDKAPNTVENFLKLCDSGFYVGTKFHRVIPGFMVQGGDPNTRRGYPRTWGEGGQTDNMGREINIKAEFNDIHHARGIVSMARAADPDSASSQFFICVADCGQLDHKYTAFGEVIKGMNVVDKIVNAPTMYNVQHTEKSRPKEPVAITATNIEYRPIDKTGGQKK